MLFKNHEHAALLLAEKLNRFKGKNPLVLGIPNRGIPIALRIAEALAGEMDAVLIEKITPPGEPNITLGAVDETGNVYLSTLADDFGLSKEILSKEKKKRETLLKEKRKQFKEMTDPFGRTVIIVDDGTLSHIAMIASLKSIRTNQPKHLVAATLMSSRESLDVIRKLADEVVNLLTPKNPYSVGNFFIDFKNVSDKEVIKIMKELRPKLKKQL